MRKTAVITKRFQFLDFIDSQDLVEIEKDQKFVIDLTDTADVLTLEAGNDNIGCRFDDIRIDFQNLGDMIDDKTGDPVVDIQDHDPEVVFIKTIGQQIEPFSKIDDRNDISPQVDDTFDKIRGIGNRSMVLPPGAGILPPPVRSAFRGSEA